MKPSASEMERSRQWTKDHFASRRASDLPISFDYDGTPVRQVIDGWAYHIAEADDYALYSTLCGGLGFELTQSPQVGMPDDFPYESAHRRLQRCREVRPYFEGDYYPLTEYSQAKDAWMAYQLDRPEQADGLVIVLKPDKLLIVIIMSIVSPLTSCQSLKVG